MTLRFKPKASTRSCQAKLAFRRLCRSVSSPYAQAALLMDDKQLSHLSIDPSAYSSSEDFRTDYLICSYLSKYKGLQTGVDTRAVALDKFFLAETQCNLVNVRLRKNEPCLVDPIIHRALRLVSNVLGEFDFAKLEGLERWGPGAASDMNRRRAYLDSKISEFPISVTRECLRVFKRAIQDDLHWSSIVLGVFPDGSYSLLDCNFLIEEGSRVDTVDKNAKTDRTISIEPRGNMFMQKAVGTFVRRRLKRVGVDLDNQGLNQELARKGFLDSLATIDLSMASDSMSIELVKLLLPFDWFYFLDLIRSRRYCLDGKVATFEKFSSMGNGFTFELESLLFWALGKASLEQEDSVISVYGDDIICKSSDAHTVISTLSWAGFSTNVDKTFIEGPFRESCGRHYFNGNDVTPIFQKEIVDSEFANMRFYNRLVRYAVKHNDGDHVEKNAAKAAYPVYMTFSNYSHPRLPFGAEGDDGYLVNHEMQPALKLVKSYGARWPVLRRTRPSIPARDEALLAYSLRLSSRTEAPFLGVSTGLPYLGMLATTDDSEDVIAKSSRWIEPSWEFALDFM